MLKVGYQMAVQTKWWYLKHRVVLIFVILSLNKIFVIWRFQKYISSGSTMMQSRNITMFIPLFILYQFYSNVLFCFFSVKWSIKIMWLSIFIIFNFYRKHYDHCPNQRVFFSKNKYIFGHKNHEKKLLYSDSNLEYWVHLSGFQEFI